MAQVVEYAFYLWLLLSFVYLVAQIVGKATGRGPSKSRTGTVKAEAPDPAARNQAANGGARAVVGAGKATATASARAADAAIDGDPVATLLAEEAATAAGADTELPIVPVPTPIPEPRAESAAPADESVELATQASQTEDAAAPEGAEESAVEAAAGPAPVVPAAEPAPAATVAGLLAGIRLPHDLMPVVPDGATSADRHVSLLTSSAPAEVVGPAMADELERLGYTLAPKSETELIATRDSNELELGIITSPALMEAGGRPVYPSATEGDVLITIDILA